jgi:hypothetical protein
MNAIRVLKHIDSDHVHIPELLEMVGQDVEITIRPQAAVLDDGEPLETLETFLGAAAHRPPPTDEELAELRELAEHDPIVEAALWLYDNGGPDVNAILDARNAERDPG